MLRPEDRITWGRYEGRRLKDVPVDYWTWCWEQEWFREEERMAALREYSHDLVFPLRSYDDLVREFMRMSP